MKLSIVIPVYRVESTLDRCLNSVVNQDFADFEVILVDDGSPDRCPQLCDEWAVKEPRIRVIHQANGGLSVARNTGIEAAKGEFITFVDSDDYVSANAYAELMPTADSCDLLEYPVWQHFRSKRQKFLDFPDRPYTDSNDYWISTQAYLHTYAWNKIYRRRLFDKVRFPVGKVFEDVYTLPLILRQQPRIMTTSRGAYFYCDNPQGITAQATSQELRMLLDAHLTSGMPMDNRYYLHVLNIQMDVYELTGDAPRLERRYIRPTGSIKQILKSHALNKLGIKAICKISKLIHLVKKPSRL